MFHRAENPTPAMLAGGAWAKIGRKHYRHATGHEVKYDGNRWGWRIDDCTEIWGTLTVAKHWVEVGKYLGNVRELANGDAT